MFFVFRKDKIYAYIVSIFMVSILFYVSSYTRFFSDEYIEVSVKNQKLLPIYKVNTNEKKVAITMNCAWNADDVDKILDILKNNNINITFFMVGDWVEKYPEYVKKIYESGNEIRKS